MGRPEAAFSGFRSQGASGLLILSANVYLVVRRLHKIGVAFRIPCHNVFRDAYRRAQTLVALRLLPIPVCVTVPSTIRNALPNRAAPTDS